MVRKSPDAFRTISEVAEILDVPAHVLRFWESRFTQIKPVKRGGGRRYYRPADIDLLRGIRDLLYRDGLTIKGVQKILREQGLRHVVELGQLDPAHDPVQSPDAPPQPEADPALRAFPDAALPDPQPTEDDVQVDLFAHASHRERRPFPPDPARAARRDQLTAILNDLLGLRQKMAASLA